MRNNPIQFAVVREDPLVEASLLWDMPQAKEVLLIASGGCTALSLQSLLPQMKFTLLDVNPSQLELIQKKFSHLHSTKGAQFKSDFNIEDSRTSGLNACGNFESLFRGLREFIFEFVVPYGEMRHLFEEENIAEASKERIFSNKYWPVGFEMYFCDDFLRAMFTEKAIQHAPKGSYPKHFKSVLEGGFQRTDARTNYFLHHIFLGHYLANDAALPIYLSKPPKSSQFRFHAGDLQSLADELQTYDLISLSNIFDWTDDSDVASMASLLGSKMKKGARLVFRQLNHTTDFPRYFSEHFRFEEKKEKELITKDRSLFYSKLNIGVKK